MRITLKDFKNYLEASFELKGITAIEGENGSGKTSLLEAILFSLYGRDFYGNIAIDGFIRKGAKSCSATLEYEGNSYRRVAGREGMVFYNGVKQRHTDVLSRLPSLELAYAIVNPLYMLGMSRLAIRKLFMDNSKLPDPVEIFKKEYTDKEDMVDRFKNGTYEEAKARHKELVNSLLAMEKQLELKSSELYSCIEGHKQVVAERVRMPSGVIARERDRQVKIDELTRKLEVIGDVTGALAQARDRIKVITQEVMDPLEESGCENLTELVAFYKDSYLKIMEEYRKLEVRASQLGYSKHDLDGKDKCPTCGSEVVWEDFIKRNESELFITKSLMEKLKPQLDDLHKKIDSLTAYKYEADQLASSEHALKLKAGEYRNLKKKVEDLRVMQRGLSEEEIKRAVTSEAQKKMIRDYADREKYLKKRITEIKKSIRDLSLELKSSSVIVDALSPKGVSAHQAAYVGSVVQVKLEKFFPNRKVEVCTVRPNKSNDRVREVFEIKVDNVSWGELSFGERILIAVIMGLVLRESVLNFPLKFVLLDEASVLSRKKLDEIQGLLLGAGLEFFYTRAKDGALNLIKY